MTKRGVAVSDLHCGSFYGLLPPNFETFEGVPKLQNPGQKFLWDCWLDFANRVESFQPHFVIINGDDIDGMQKKSHGAELSLTNWRDQRQAAIATLKVLRSVTRKAKWYFTQGTPYHVGHFGSAEEDIAEAMGGTAYPGPGSGKLCREVLLLDIDGVLIEAAHHIAFASVYPATPLDKEVRGADADRDERVPDLMIRSHVHRKKQIDQRIITTPCWELQTRYQRKSYLHLVKPDIGGTYIEVDSSAKKAGYPPCQVKFETYTLPQRPIASL